MNIEIDDWIIYELKTIVDMHKKHGAPNKMENVNELVSFVLSAIVDGSENPNSREHVLLEIMGIDWNGDEYKSECSQHDIPVDVAYPNNDVVDNAYNIMIKQFWNVYDKLIELLGEDAINFSANIDLIAVNLPYFILLCHKHEFGFFKMQKLRQALERCNKPKLLDRNRVTWSAHKQKNFRCLVFRK